MESSSPIREQVEDAGERFSLIAGGPFHGLLGRLGLLGADRLPTLPAAIAWAAAAWLPPAILVVWQALVEHRDAAWGFFTDGTVYSRYLIAIVAMIATERHADGRFRILVRQFREANLVGPETAPDFLRALSSADRRTSSTFAEVAILAAALFLPGLTASYAVSTAGVSWEGAIVDGQVVLSWAGVVTRFVSTPIFAFLLFRWIWRFVVWGALLFGISRLPLQLTPLHPDRSAGLGFLAIYPSVFSGFVFGLSCVVASVVVKEMGLVSHDRETIWLGLAVWLGLILLLFLGPLFLFSPVLSRVREKALLEYGRLANQHHLAFDRRWIVARRSGEELMGSSDPSSTSDLNATVESIRSMQSAPIDRQAVTRLVVAAGVPLLAVIARQVSLSDFLKWIVTVIL